MDYGAVDSIPFDRIRHRDGCKIIVRRTVGPDNDHFLVIMNKLNRLSRLVVND